MSWKRSPRSISDVIRFVISSCFHVYFPLPWVSPPSLRYAIRISWWLRSPNLHVALTGPLVGMCFLLLYVCLKPNDPSSPVMPPFLPQVPWQCLKWSMDYILSGIVFQPYLVSFRKNLICDDLPHIGFASRSKIDASWTCDFVMCYFCILHDVTCCCSQRFFSATTFQLKYSSFIEKACSSNSVHRFCVWWIMYPPENGLRRAKY